jgi:enoyl-CoA hydratase
VSGTGAGPAAGRDAARAEGSPTPGPLEVPVLLSRDGPVGIVELARPRKFNCLSDAAHTAIEGALAAFEAPDSGVRAVLLRAQGKHFCTGADLDEFGALRERPEEMAKFMAHGHAVLRRLEASPLPVVAACQGLVLAGGLELMLACDVVFAGRDARFGDQHAQFGLVPGWGGSQRLPRLVGLRRAMDLFLSARWIDADTAQQWGLVNYVVEAGALGEAALAYARTLSTRSRDGLAAMKRLARRGLDLPLAEGLAFEEREAAAALLGADVDEGLAAMHAKRTPVFRA